MVYLLPIFPSYLVSSYQLDFTECWRGGVEKICIQCALMKNCKPIQLCSKASLDFDFSSIHIQLQKSRWATRLYYVNLDPYWPEMKTPWLVYIALVVSPSKILLLPVFQGSSSSDQFHLKPFHSHTFSYILLTSSFISHSFLIHTYKSRNIYFPFPLSSLSVGQWKTLIVTHMNNVHSISIEDNIRKILWN